MKTTVRLFFDIGPGPEKTAASILVAAGCGPDVAEVSPGFDHYDDDGDFLYSSEWVEIKLDADDERLAKVYQVLAKQGIDPSKETRVEYSEEDFQNARLLKMTPGSDYLQSVTSELGTKYDLSQACPHCGTGAKQVWYERVKRKELPLLRKHRAIMTRANHILVDASIRQLLVDAGCTGISFAEVHAREELGDWNPIDREQILIEHTMPPMRGEPTELDEKHRCKVCRRGGRFFDSDKPYRVEDLAGMQDFNLTWEWFGFFAYDGHARRANFAVPRVLVTPKVRNLFRSADVTTFDWTPVHVEG